MSRITKADVVVSFSPSVGLPKSSLPRSQNGERTVTSWRQCSVLAKPVRARGASHVSLLQLSAVCLQAFELLLREPGVTAHVRE
eukprot:6037883-Prymnesium_polylepis.1